MDMRTDVIAVPHAGLGFHFLRIQVRRPRKEVEVHLAEVPKVAGGQQLQKKKHRSSERQGDDVACTSAELISPLLEDWSESLSTP